MENEDLEYVGFWARVVATIVDSLLLIIVTFPFLLIFYGLDYLDSEGLVVGPVDFLLSYVFPIVATLVFWFWKQATPGKMALSAKIVDARTGNEPSAGQYIGRYFAYILSALPLCLGFLWIAFDSKKQGWHDKLAGTVVIRPKNHTEAVKFEKD
ncbi:RDD family protein [Fibrobacter sp. UWP2]|uniref:RDD family protein n=1 Tax=Fibrobacter sp. UWP2 TaxID=1896216 RepID=UPI00091ECC88|nr:RDD family protein [Fibrobacter sp. UWP2]SHI58452.1 Uncharacterized membrane protein YckC, RDD family [Fibrobacter sp. UWP2]